MSWLLYYPAWPCADLRVTPFTAAGPHFHGAPAPVYKAAFFPQVPTACRAAGNASPTAGQVGAGTWETEPGKD